MGDSNLDDALSLPLLRGFDSVLQRFEGVDHSEDGLLGPAQTSRLFSFNPERLISGGSRDPWLQSPDGPVQEVSGLISCIKSTLPRSPPLGSFLARPTRNWVWRCLVR